MLVITKKDMSLMQEIYFCGYNIRYIDEAKQGARGYRADVITSDEILHFNYKTKDELYTRGLELLRDYNTRELNAIRLTIGRVVVCLVSAWNRH